MALIHEKRQKTRSRFERFANGGFLEGYSGNATTTSVRATPAPLNFSAAFAEFVMLPEIRRTYTYKLWARGMDGHYRLAYEIGQADVIAK